MASTSTVPKKSAKKRTKERTYLTEEESKLLQSVLEEWYSKPDKPSRDAFVSSEVLPKIQKLDPNKYGSEVVSRSKELKILWEQRVQAVHTWLKNHKPFKDRAVFKLERKISSRQVLSKTRAGDIHSLVLEKNPDVQKGDKAYPGLFQQALTELKKTLSQDELDELETTAKEWQDTGPPMDVRLRAAKRYSRKGISNAHQILHKQMFVSCVTFSFFPDPETGVIGIVWYSSVVEVLALSKLKFVHCHSHDYIADIHLKSHGKKFKTFKEWNTKGYDRIIEDLIGYADYVDSERKDTGEAAPKPTPITLNTGPGLLPLLPPPSKGVRGSETAKQGQEIVRAYFLRHYHMATGLDTSHTPWAQIGNDPSKFFDEACMPEGFKFQDPSRMGLSVKIILDHLRKRQDELGVNAFHFHHILSNQKLQDAAYPPQALRVIESGNGKDWPAESNTSAGQEDEEGTEQPIKKRKISKKKAKKRVDATPERMESRDMAISNASDLQTDDTDHGGVGILTEKVPNGSSDKTEGDVDMELVNSTPKSVEAVCQPITQDVIDSSQSDSSPALHQGVEKTEDQPIPGIKQQTLGHQSGGPPNAFIFPPEAAYPAGHKLHQLDIPSHAKPPNAFIFPPETAYVGKTSDQSDVPSHGMPLTGPPGQSWLHHPMYAPNEINSAPYPYPPYQMGPTMAVYHPQYGYQHFAVDPHLNQAFPQPTPANVGLHLQVPPGEPVFSTAHRNFNQGSDMSHNSSLPMSSVMATPSASKILIKPPTYTPSKQSPVKKSPLKRPRADDISAQTPTRRSGRIPKTPKNLIQ